MAQMQHLRWWTPFWEGAATLCEEVLAPLNASGDKEGCHLNDGVVTTPKGFK